jgi:hypothetical protein
MRASISTSTLHAAGRSGPCFVRRALLVRALDNDATISAALGVRRRIDGIPNRHLRFLRRAGSIPATLNDANPKKGKVGKGFADSRNVAVFTFHCEQPHAANGGQVRRQGVLHFAFRQCMFDKHGVDCLQKEFGGQIHDRPVFIIKFAVFGGRISIAGDKMIEEIEMCVWPGSVRGWRRRTKRRWRRLRQACDRGEAVRRAARSLCRSFRRKDQGLKICCAANSNAGHHTIRDYAA